MQNDRSAKWRWCQICQHCRKLWWSSYIETAAEMLPKDGSSKVAWPLRLCNICLFFTWRRATMKIEGFLMGVCCLKLCGLRGRDGLWSPAFSGHRMLAMIIQMYRILFLHLSISLWCFWSRTFFSNNGFECYQWPYIYIYIYIICIYIYIYLYIYHIYILN